MKIIIDNKIFINKVFVKIKKFNAIIIKFTNLR